MEIPAKMMADPRLRGDDENGCGDDMRLQTGGGFPHQDEKTQKKTPRTRGPRAADRDRTGNH